MGGRAHGRGGVSGQTTQTTSACRCRWRGLSEVSLSAVGSQNSLRDNFNRFRGATSLAKQQATANSEQGPHRVTVHRQLSVSDSDPRPQSGAGRPRPRSKVLPQARPLTAHPTKAIFSREGRSACVPARCSRVLSLSFHPLVHLPHLCVSCARAKARQPVISRGEEDPALQRDASQHRARSGKRAHDIVIIS